MLHSTKIRTKLATLIALSAMILGPITGLRAAITNGLVAHLTFDNTYVDASGNGVNGSAVNGPTFESGKIGQAVHMAVKKDGSLTNYVTLSYPSKLVFGSDATGDATDFSFSFWVQILTHLADEPFLANKDWDSGSNPGFVLANQDDGMKWNYKDDLSGRRDSPHVGPQLQDKNWHHIAVTFQRSGNGSIYVDGTLVNQTSIAPDSGIPIGSVDTDGFGYGLNLGNDGRGDYPVRDSAEIDFLMDDLGIWRRVLSNTEVASIFAGGLAGQDLANVTVKVPPVLQSLAPASGTKGAAGNTAIVATVKDADTQVDPATIQLSLDSQTLNKTDFTVSTVSGVTTVTYSPTNVFAPNSTHTASFSFSDNGTVVTKFQTNWTFTVLNYGVLPASLAQAPGTVKIDKPGFKLRVNEIDATGPNINANIAHAEAQLAGFLKKDDGTKYDNIATPGDQPDGTFITPGVLNFAVDPSTAQGFFANDNPVPGISGTAPNDGQNMVVEIMGYLQLNAGYYRFGVRSDHGFRMTVGLHARNAFGTQLGMYDSARIAPADSAIGETTFDFSVAQTGFYWVRILWFKENLGPHAQGSPNFELFTVAPTGDRILVNDSSNPASVKAFYDSSATYPPYVRYAGPTAFVSNFHGPDFGSKTVDIQIADADGPPVDKSSVKLFIDGNDVTSKATITQAGGITTVTYTPDPPQLLRTVHSAQLTYAPTGGTPKTPTWQFDRLKNYNNFPAPLFSENFDTTAQGTFPPGWVQENHTGSQTAGLDPADLNSDFYLGWVVLENGTIPTKGFGVAPGQEFNGTLFDADSTGSNPLMSNNIVYAESDSRQNGPPGQIQYLSTPVYDLSGKTGVVIKFNSGFEQNQDGLNSLEYTTDNGTNWHPVFYWLMGPPDNQGPSPSDILRDANGDIDVAATMNTVYGDVAAYTDPTTQKLVGNTFRFYVKAPITQALAPYIEGRVNDDGAESKRVEVFSVPNADNQKTVQFRFVQAGTSSWYWGVDQWAIYSILSSSPPPPASPTITAARNGTSVTLSWPASVTGFTLESADSLSNPTWTAVSGVANNSVTVQIGAGSKFYRLRK